MESGIKFTERCPHCNRRKTPGRRCGCVGECRATLPRVSKAERQRLLRGPARGPSGLTS